jgi:dUTP pyrophosphatase
MIQLKVKKLRPEATLPTKGTSEAAGWDLYAAEDLFVWPLNTVVPVPTGIAVAIPKGYVGLVCSRSGAVYKGKYCVANQPGIIDSDYRGEVKVLLTPFNEMDTQVFKGDRIAQLVIVPIPEVEILEVSDLDATDRGEGGFGSTGVR